MKKWYLSKTIQLAILQGIAGILIAFYTQYPGAGYILVLKSIVDGILRTITTQPVK